MVKVGQLDVPGHSVQLDVTTHTSSSRRTSSLRSAFLAPVSSLLPFMPMPVQDILDAVKAAARTCMYQDHHAAASQNTPREEPLPRGAYCAARGQDHAEERPSRGEKCVGPLLARVRGAERMACLTRGHERTAACVREAAREADTPNVWRW
jgi:hypothetical protein